MAAEQLAAEVALDNSKAASKGPAELSEGEREKYEYLRDALMPTLGGSLEALLREMERRQPRGPSDAKPQQISPLNPVNFIAEHLMRNNPNANAGLETSQ